MIGLLKEKSEIEKLKKDYQILSEQNFNLKKDTIEPAITKFDIKKDTTEPAVTKEELILSLSEL